MSARGDWRRWTFRIYAAVLLTLTHLPPAQINRIPFKLWDKAEHTIAYFILACLALWAAPGWPGAGHARRFVVLLTIGLLMLFGALDELTQPWVGRSCELTDWLADSFGVMLGMTLMWRVRQ